MESAWKVKNLKLLWQGYKQHCWQHQLLNKQQTTTAVLTTTTTTTTTITQTTDNLAPRQQESVALFITNTLLVGSHFCFTVDEMLMMMMRCWWWWWWWWWWWPSINSWHILRISWWFETNRINAFLNGAGRLADRINLNSLCYDYIPSINYLVEHLKLRTNEISNGIPPLARKYREIKCRKCNSM